MKAVVANRIGTVHRLIVRNNGDQATGCGMPWSLYLIEVRPVQALVYHLAACEHCWPAPAQWQRWLDGAA